MQRRRRRCCGRSGHRYGAEGRQDHRIGRARADRGDPHSGESNRCRPDRRTKSPSVTCRSQGSRSRSCASPAKRASAESPSPPTAATTALAPSTAAARSGSRRRKRARRSSADRVLRSYRRIVESWSMAPSFRWMVQQDAQIGANGISSDRSRSPQDPPGAKSPNETQPPMSDWALGVQAAAGRRPAMLVRRLFDCRRLRSPLSGRHGL